MTRNNIYLTFLCIRRRKRLFTLITSALVFIPCIYVLVNRVLIPRDKDLELQHFIHSSSEQHHFDDIKLLIEPSLVPCYDNAPTPLLVLVASSPAHYEQREVIRQTWGQYLHTYFVLGLAGHNVQETMPTFDRDTKHSYKEMEQHDDLIGYDFYDHDQNRTLKSVLMLRWTVERCPRVQVLFKTEDDVLVNPWNLKAILKQHSRAVLLGYMHNNTALYRDDDYKWNIPRWMRVPDSVVPSYLGGNGYIIRGYYIEPLLKAAKRVPFIDMEDIYITYLLANVELKLDLSHDRTLNTFTPLVSSVNCFYLNQVLFLNKHFKPDNSLQLWEKIVMIRLQYKDDKTLCKFYTKYIEDILLYFSY